MPDPTGYSLLSYGYMLDNRPRVTAYRDALRAAITPGCKVIDIGAGPGVFALMACQLGAGRVVAIEPDDSISLLAEIAERNGFADRIEVVQGLSSDYRPEQRADVIVSDLRGALPLFEGHIPAIVDARERLLQAGGTLIAISDTLRIALVENAKLARGYAAPWKENDFGLDLTPGLRHVTNTHCTADLTPEDLLSDGHILGVIDYRTVRDPNFTGTVDLRVERSGTVHGFGLWFDAHTSETTGFSNAPGEPRQVYGQTFLPLAEPADLAVGDVVSVEVRATLVENRYVWSWFSTIRRADAAPIEFRQSSHLAKVIAPASLAAHAASFVPQPSPDTDVDRHALGLIDGRRAVGEIAAELRSTFPERYASDAEALDYAVRLATRYRHPTVKAPQ